MVDLLINMLCVCGIVLLGAVIIIAIIIALGIAITVFRALITDDDDEDKAGDKK